jgi:branched-chain amino acid transport system ATP-binding protein
MLLEARDVTKAFGSFKAVDAASVTLEQGDILGLIGPNGAGKSTFFNCLTGDLASTSARCCSKAMTSPSDAGGAGAARARPHLPGAADFEGMTVLENVMIGAFLRTAHRARPRAKAAPCWSASA